jgi:hypothetical protein
VILAPAQLPLKQYPTNSKTYREELQNYFSSLLNESQRYSGYLSKVVGKQTFTALIFTYDDTISDVLVIDSSLAGIVNYPSSDKTLAESASVAFEKLANDGFIYSGSLIKKVSTSNFTYLVFYRHGKSADASKSVTADKVATEKVAKKTNKRSPIESESDRLGYL